MVLRNDGQEELSPPIWCSSRGTQSPKACVNTPEGATAWFGPNPPQKHIIQVDQTDPLKTFLKGEPQTLGVAQILIGLMKVCLFAIGLCFYSSGFSYQCHPLTMVSGYLIWGSLFVTTHQAEWILPCLVLRIGSCVYCCWEKDDIKPGKDFPGPEATTKIRSALSQDRRNNLQFSESAGLCGGHGKFLHEETEIKGSLGMNILSAVVGGIGVIILTVELAVDHGSEKRCLILRVFETVILVLSLLEVSITISLSVFGCKVTCFVTQVVVIQPTNDQVPPVKAPYEHVYEDLEF
ncbi:membrane-spanning 4-domains subfamily A member 4A-like isoform X3 [Ursus americanus]|uniref:membrane-spanning 4-domains subfamily A member 4A-like isoform X3 n=1 Tax=Ursus americanus TaxID=9643 RepID=UPI001E679D57|nr:membrane-spanning 4-domains subfamily A member 4A-like isoform X3 [Ursus americanus]